MNRERRAQWGWVSASDKGWTAGGREGTLSEVRIRRVHAVSVFLTEITEWGWGEAPTRRLLFSSDVPRLPRPLPRYLPPDVDRRLREALLASPNRLVADALLLARACGLRIGELLDMELDCVHQVPGQGFWLKVPLGKLDTERMVPLDDETVALVDRRVATRSPGRLLTHSHTGRPADFLFTHHGRRLSQTALRRELARIKGNWRDVPAIKARLAGGFCLRAPAQGTCPYANICEHCPNFRTDASYLPILAAQGVDAVALAADAEAKGWISEADRHRRLMARLDALMAEAQAG